jgi:hypothetical protein
MKIQDIKDLDAVQQTYLSMKKPMDETYNKKLDMDKDGKLTANDFKILRKKKKDLDEKTLTPTDIKQKEEIVKGMKKNLPYFKKKYGKNAEGVMYATATKIAQNESFLNPEDLSYINTEVLQSQHSMLMKSKPGSDGYLARLAIGVELKKRNSYK